MNFEGNSNIFDLLLDKDMKSVMDSLDTPWTSTENSQFFKEDLFELNEPRIKLESDELIVDDLLGPCYNPSDFIIPFEPKSSPSSDIDLKEEDLDDLISVPFDSVMNCTDAGFESASDSGVSGDNPIDVLHSPSSDSPMTADNNSFDHLGDIPDSTSDVSFSSDLGSIGSVADSPNGIFETPNNNSTSAMVQNSQKQQQQQPGLERSNIPSPCVPVASTTLPISRTAKSQSSVLTNAHSDVKTLSNSSSVSVPSITARTIKLDLSHSKTPIAPTSKIQSFRPILKRVRIDSPTSAPVVSQSTLQQSCNDTSGPAPPPPTFVVTTSQNKTTSTVLKNGALLRAGNGKSILLPVNMKDFNQVRTIKIINPNSSNRSSGTIPTGGVTKPTFYTATKGADGRPIFKVTPTAFVTPSRHGESVRIGSAARVIKSHHSGHHSDDDDEEVDDYDEEVPKPNQRLILTDEERKLMRKEGLVLPTRYPLTRQEERDLKRIRRKIRNKISAQDSRKRKKEYMDDLEEKVKKYAEENNELHSRIENLEKQNEGLLLQLKKFQNTSTGVGHHVTRNQSHASTALMMLMLSAALIVMPSLRHDDNARRSQNDLSGGTSRFPGRTRNLLQVSPSTLTLDGSVDEFCDANEDMSSESTSSFNSPELPDHDYSPCSKKPRLDLGSSQRGFGGVEMNDGGGFSLDSGKPPDGGIGGVGSVLQFLGRLMNPLAGNWSNSGGVHPLGKGAVASSEPMRVDQPSSVIVKMPEPRLKEIELE